MFHFWLYRCPLRFLLILGLHDRLCLWVDFLLPLLCDLVAVGRRHRNRIVPTVVAGCPTVVLTLSISLGTLFGLFYFALFF